ncbi:MAG TPA: hypothetical protein PLZ95_05645 [Bryobacteraceae bacterium]|nr:hypothetical protein [Bryobacteraceae bacterium]
MDFVQGVVRIDAGQRGLPASVNRKPGQDALHPVFVPVFPFSVLDAPRGSVANRRSTAIDLAVMRPLPKSAVGPINNIGFFHFGSDDKSDPMRSLAISLEKAVTTKRCLTGSLLVLPEAFNIRNDYQTLSAPDPSVVYALKEMSKEHGMAFVAGLLHRRTRYSCAHLIDGDTCRLLSRKRDRDGSPNYQPYEGV